MTSTRPTLAVGMVGYAFMGAAHSQAWRTAPRFFDLPLTPAMQVVCGRDAERTAEAAARLGWAETETDWHRLVERAGRRPRRHLHARRHARRDRDRRAGRGQARAVREAAGQLGRRGRGDDRRRRAGRGARRTRHGRLHLPPGAGDRAGPTARRRGPDRRGAARAGAVPPGLDRRPRGAALLAARQGQGGLRRARRHRRPHRRPHPAHHRPADHRGVRAARDVREGATRRHRARGTVRARPAPSADRSPSTTPRSSSPGSPGAGSASSRRPGSPPAARTRSGSRSTARRAAWPSTSRT